MFIGSAQFAQHKLSPGYQTYIEQSAEQLEIRKEVTVVGGLWEKFLLYGACEVK
jgi:hypothetical protein